MREPRFMTDGSALDDLAAEILPALMSARSSSGRCGPSENVKRSVPAKSCMER
jgi:hypothetical protein